MDKQDRLTRRNPDGDVTLIGEDSLPMVRLTERVSAALEKLASYEDAEEQGRLVRLPCKIGDIVYFLHGNVVERSVVIAYYIAKNRTEFLLTKTKVYSAYYVPVEQMGKTVFTTRAEAEAALQTLIAAQ